MVKNKENKMEWVEIHYPLYGIDAKEGDIRDITFYEYGYPEKIMKKYGTV